MPPWSWWRRSVQPSCCVKVGVSAEPREDHAHYLKSWIAVLKADNRAIFSAASAAQKAADYLQGLQPP